MPLRTQEKRDLVVVGNLYTPSPRKCPEARNIPCCMGQVVAFPGICNEGYQYRYPPFTLSGVESFWNFCAIMIVPLFLLFYTFDSPTVISISLFGDRKLDANNY